jgi:hypothetical protein
MSRIQKPDYMICYRFSHVNSQGLKDSFS